MVMLRGSRTVDNGNRFTRILLITVQATVDRADVARVRGLKGIDPGRYEILIGHEAQNGNEFGGRAALIIWKPAGNCQNAEVSAIRISLTAGTVRHPVDLVPGRRRTGQSRAAETMTTTLAGSSPLSM